MLKLDRSFIKDMAVSEPASKIVRAVAGLASDLNMETVVEGVETAEQFEFLRRQGCDVIQGYYFSEPLAAPDFESKILQRATAVS